jgi:hypothetical protein
MDRLTDKSTKEEVAAALAEEFGLDPLEAAHYAAVATGELTGDVVREDEAAGPDWQGAPTPLARGSDRP